jgi:amino acid adenylation domain-containing protein
MVNDTPVAPAELTVEEKRRLLAQRLQQRARRDTFPLSFSQQRLWFLHRMDPDSPAYNIPLALRARGELDAGVLRRALRALAERHDSLRTTFAERDGRLVQVVGADAPDLLAHVDLRGVDQAAREAELARLAAEAATRPFDLARGPLLRAVAVRLADAEWGLLFTLHHVVGDGWSLGVLSREVSELYAAFAAGRPPALPPLPMQYPEFALWQRGWLKDEVLEGEMAFWREELAGAPHLLELPTDRPRPAAAGPGADVRAFTLGPETSAALGALARREGATLFMTLLAAWQLLLARWSGQDDVLVGTPIAGRTRADVEGLIGLFLNTLVIRARLSGAPTFRALLAQVRERTLGAFAHQHLPFEKLVEELAVERSLAHGPLFQVLFALQNNERPGLALGGARFEPIDLGVPAAKFDLVLNAAEGARGVGGTLAFRTDLFDGATAERMLEHYAVLLRSVAADPDRPLADHELIGEGERRRVVEEWNATAAPFADLPLHRLFEAQAARTPHAPALVFGAPGGQALTYAELDARANRLAHHLRALGVGVEGRVGLFLERSADAVVALFGVLKAGGAYLPLEPGYPDDRLRFMLADAGAAAVVTNAALAERVAPFTGAVVRLDADAGAIAARPAHAPGVAVAPENLAYVIYTSGSTGTPKGVLTEHRSVASYLAWFDAVSRDEAGCAFPLVSRLSFDAHVRQLFPPLLRGEAAWVLPEETVGDPAALLAALATRERVSFGGVPSLWGALVEAVRAGEAAAPAGVRAVRLGGEALPAELAEKTRALFPGVAVWNHYGPTEGTVNASLARVREGARVTIGRPVANARVHLLDAALRPVPVRVPGELYIAGLGVARGYLGRPGLTAEKFVPDPFSPVPGARMYRSGDRARWTEEGEIDYLGRTDFQVKVRGFRIEPGEIEALLERHPGVRQAVVVAREDAPGRVRLVGYAAGDAGAAPSPAELRAYLKERLPEYMVPAAVVVLDALPRNAHGKVDRRALPAPEAPADADAERAPRTATEEILAGLFAEVLKVERVGAGVDFFELGGHSLLATRLAARVREAFAVELPLRALFEAPTVDALAGRVDALLREGRGVQAPPLVPVPREGALPLSFAQARLWFLDQLEPGSAAYNMPYALRLRGALDAAALERSLEALAARHETLRTRFPGVDGEPAQVVDPAGPVFLARIDLSGLDADAREGEARRLAAAEAALPFDLAAGPLFRSTLLRLGPEEHVVLFTLHHVVSDGWSTGVLVREVSELYAAFVEGREPRLPALPVQYADYAAWQRAWLSGPVLEAQLGYWSERLAGAPELLEMPTDRPRPAAPDHRGDVRSFTLAPETARAVEALARREGATLFMTLAAAWQLLLSRYSGRDDVLVGTPIANRTRREVEGLIGFFANTLVLRTDLSGDPPFRRLVGRVREAALSAYANQDLPFERLVEAVRPERSLAHSPVFQAMFQLLNAERGGLEMGGVRIERMDAGSGTAKFDLLLSMVEGGGTLAGSLEFRTELWDGATIERMLGHFATLLDAVARNPDARVGALPLLGAGERARVLEAWNATAAEVPAERCLHDLFTAAAGRTPDAPAIVFRGETVTFRALDAWSNRLARHLRGLGVVPDSRVGICLERGPEMMAAVLGVLKAGGACVPVDPAYPAERIAYMLADSAAPVLLTQSSLVDALPSTEAWVVRVDADADEIGRESAEPFAGGALPDHLAYVIYTSGSTGRPKGVAMPHRPLVSLLAWQAREWRHPSASATLQFTTLSFDVSFQEIFSCWDSGGRLVLVSEDERRDFAAVLDRLEGEGIERLFLPYVALQHLAEVAEERGIAPRRLREVRTAGEQLRVTAPIRRFFSATGAVLGNQYGPSETHVATAEVLEGDPAAWPLLPPIGAPVANTRCYVLDPHGEPAPAGVPGELFLAGDCVARGYLGRPALTAERFVPNPFGAPGARAYRTGDRARWIERTGAPAHPRTGALEFLGRVDDQVKVRGFRIEPGEVEAALESHASVREAAVVVREDAPGERRLVGYVVAAPGAQAEAAELRAHLRGKLPEYMVPSAFVVLDAFPLTPSGKVARRALPAPDAAPAGAQVEPRTPAEEILAGIYAEVLRLERVGVEESFFALGGHSLLATRLVSRVRGAFGVELPLRALFEAPTVAALAGRVEALAREGRGVQAPPLVPVPRDRPLPLSFAQARLWFIDQLQPGSAAYNIPYALRLKGALDAEALERSLAALAARHETLRTRFAVLDGEPVQVIDPAGPVSLERIDLSHLSVDAREAELRSLASAEAARPFDLAAGPLFRSTLARLGREEHAVLFTLHHVVSDGWSTGILVREVSELYAAFSEGREPRLPPLPVQYADFAAWQRAWLSGDVLDAQLAYWREKLAGAPPLLELPTDRPRPLVQGARGGLAFLALSDQTTHALRALARREGATLFMTLLAGWQLLLSRYAGEEDVSVGTPIAGRTRLETEGLIGFFVNTLVLRADLSGDPTFRALLGRVREATLGAYAHQDIPFEKLVEELAPERSLSHTPLFQAMFVFQNNAAEALRLGALEAEPLAGDGGTTKFDLLLALGEAGGRVAGALSYRAELWDAATIERMLGHFGALLDAVAAEPDRPVGAVPFLGDGERRRLVEEWNATARPYALDLPLHALVEARAARDADAVAVVFEDDSLTYAELDAHANRLARHLARLGVGPEARVGVCLERSPEMVVALLAVLKAGGAYVPIDPAYPAERVAHMLGDSGVGVVLTQERLLPTLPEHGAKVVCLDADAEAIASESPEATGVEVSPEQLAYVIYTSGSTGRPKGAMNAHRGVVNRLLWMQEAYGLAENDVVLQKTPFSFDVSVWEFFWPLLAGARLVLARPGGHGDPAYLSEVVEAEGVTTLHFVPSMLQAFLDAGDVARCGSLRRVVCSGEALPYELMERTLDALPGAALHNLYGPTEAAVDVTHWTCERRPGRPVVPIGRPVANTRIHVLDPWLNVVPAGVSGELFIAGVQVGRGYLGRPALTAEKFVPDPFSTTPGARARVPGPHRLPGEGARLPHRAGGDRGRAARGTAWARPWWWRARTRAASAAWSRISRRTVRRPTRRRYARR